jgi:probable phosphoglycerate mutase
MGDRQWRKGDLLTMREKEKSTSVIFVRHGKTDFPLDRIYCDDREDPALNALGQQQAAAAARSLQGRPVSAIYTSPCLRTVTTAGHIADTLGMKPQEERGLMERRFGIWEGLYFNEIMNGYPEEHRRWKEDNAGFKPEGGESIYDLIDRLEPALERIRGRHKGEVVVVVSHVGPIRTAIAHAVGLPLERYRQLKIDYASLSRIDYGKRQNNLAYLNLPPGTIGEEL